MEKVLTPTVLCLAFALSALGELYYFMMQRSSLAISRAADCDGRFMLPLWDVLLWPIHFVKWGAALAMGFTIH